ncbi:MAG: alpha-L-fucosidase, partial [Tepidisphaerales bacterium]
MAMNSRMLFVIFALLTSASFAADVAPPAPMKVVPSPQQVEWQRRELTTFVHFGVNTFTNREWGEGKENEKIFNPEKLDARQWARAAKAGGSKLIILTAKHHDGFCLWPSKYTNHSVKSSPWKDGKGDVVREFVDAARAEELKVGLYLSPWDRNAPSYGDSPKYNEYYRNQLTELLTNYGEITEVWFDGACGEGPNGKRQVYDWPAVHELVLRLQPAALMFSDAGPGVRWIGNERGTAGDPCWSVVNSKIWIAPGKAADGARDANKSLQNGDPAGDAWIPGECDVSIRPGWFNHPAEDGKVKTPDQLVDLYFKSVGRNALLLLNVPPTRDGLFHDNDVRNLAEFRHKLDNIFAKNLAAARPVTATNTRGKSDAFAAANVVDDSLYTY